MAKMFKYLIPVTVFVSFPLSLHNGPAYFFSINKTKNSTLPPIINAIEIYKAINILQSLTSDEETAAMMSMKSAYRISRNWQGDPCAPRKLVWDGLVCSYDGFNPPRIISLDLSSSGISGEVPAAISNLTMLQTLNLEGNNFTGPIPSMLLEKWQDGTLSFRVVILIVISVIAVLVVVLLLAVLWRKKKQESQKGKEISRYALEPKHKQYTYQEIISITKKFQKAIGCGSYGVVYHGLISDEIEVAVKMFSSPSSDEGFKELQLDANVLMSVHHRNLTSLIGYCFDGTHIGIIYEYMENGDLRGHLSERSSRVLSWQERMQIAVDVSQGLEYMHHGCKPPIVHRDIKLLAPEGILILDPAYEQTGNLTQRSDVYSFGVVILLIITAKPAFHLVEWVSFILQKEDVKDVVDPRLMGAFDVPSASKALQIAMNCASHDPTSRPTINNVVIELKQCLSMEMTRVQMMPDRTVGVSSRETEVSMMSTEVLYVGR
ncbi:hypothetical protein Leryth_003762 [Lithospermum erythrorhizon]|nr:hypothetical protein Leryth_003762 [Lithospermum erythrorhizon]